MSVFEHPAFDHHEQVVFCADPDSGLRAIIAIHDTRLGPALGGCRMWPYASGDEAVHDALRLARGMSYKSALAGLPLGGGKSVIIGDPRRDKTPGLLCAFGRFLDSLGGRYIAAEDSGTTVEDLRAIGKHTGFVAGVTDKPTGVGRRSGDPSPATAHGVFVGIRTAVAHRLGRDGLDGLRVAIQGTGSVGMRLGGMLRDAGCRLWISDLYPDRADRAADELGAEPVPADSIYDVEADVFAPCAMGAVINDQTLPRLRARVVAGCANNQLAEDRHGQALMARDILYAPDYAINAGGIIDIACERDPGGFDRAVLLRRLENIGETLRLIFERARLESRPPEVVADELARERLAGAG